MKDEAATQEQERFDQIIEANLSQMSGRLLVELREVVDSLRSVGDGVLNISACFDNTMCAPFSLDLQTVDGNFFGYPGLESLLGGLSIYPDELQGDYYDDDEWIERTMHLIAPWMAENWDRAGGRSMSVSAFLISDLNISGNKFDLETRLWEPRS